MMPSVVVYVDTSSLLQTLIQLHWFLCVPLILLYSKVSRALSRELTPPPMTLSKVADSKEKFSKPETESVSSKTESGYQSEDDDLYSPNSSGCMTPTSTKAPSEVEATVASTGLDNVAIKDWTGTMMVTPIDKQGSVILIVGTEAQAPGSNNLRVSDKALCCASPVFKAMLAPYYSAELDKFPSKTISLPDDDPLAMEIFCNIIHQRKIIQHLHIDDVSLILRVALICEKYDAFLPLGGYLHGWCDKKGDAVHDSSTCADSLRLLSVAYMLKNHELFETYSYSIIRRFPKQEMETAVELIGREFAPSRTIIERMCLLQREYLLDFQKAVERIIRTELKAGGCCFESRKAKYDTNPVAHPKPSTCIRAIRIGHFLSLADHSKFWRLEKSTLSPTALRVEFHTLIWSSPNDYGKLCGCTLTNLTTGLTTAHRNYQEATKGLCLNCVLDGTLCNECQEVD